MVYICGLAYLWSWFGSTLIERHISGEIVWSKKVRYAQKFSSRSCAVEIDFLRFWQKMPSAFISCMSSLPSCYMQPLYCCQGVFFKIPSVSQRQCAFEIKGSGYYIWQLFLSIRINGLMFQNFLSMNAWLPWKCEMLSSRVIFKDLLANVFFFSFCRHANSDLMFTCA